MAYKITRLDFRSSNGQSKIVSKIYVPCGEVKGIVQIVHGMCEYIDRYKEFMGFLADNGYIVCGNDHLGHGESVQSMEHIGFFTENCGYKYLIRDVYKLNMIMHKDYPNLPYFLLGHSMGSLMARIYMTKYGDTVDGLILSGTVGPNPNSVLGVKMAGAIKRRHGVLYRSRFLEQLAFGSYHKKIRNPVTSKEWISRDREVVDRYVNDPLCMFTFSAAAFKDLFLMHSMANEACAIKKLDKNKPIFLFSGQMDPCGEYGKGVAKVYKRMVSEEIRDVSIKLYPGGRHEMLNEINRQEVYEDVLYWLEQHLVPHEPQE